MASENSRIKLLEREQVAPEAAALYDVLRAQRGVVPNMFKVLSYSPEIAKGVAGFLKPMLSDGALPGWYKELIAVRISILCESQYAIRAHSASARQKGASEAQISSVSDFENGPYTEKEKLGLRLADRLHRGASEIDDAFYAQLQTEFADTAIMELFLVAAAFELFPRFIDGLRIPITPLPAAK
jgi:4-carboxymuconolactone decarboxylase